VAHHGVIQSDRSIGELVRDIATHTEEFVRAEIQLGIAEVREEVAGVVKRGIFALAGGALGMLAIVLFLLSAVFALTLVMAAWLAALLVGLVVAAVAAVFLMKAARPALQEVKPVPDIATGGKERPWSIARTN
jgi:hypothetical protein